MLEFYIFTNDTCTDERALVNKETQEIIMMGDRYHDNIETKIDGFLTGLQYGGIDYTALTVRTLKTNKWFEKCGFTDFEVFR